MILVGTHGPAKSGKSTIARYLVDDWGFHEVSFAAPIKRMVSTGLGIDLRDLESQELKEQMIPWLEVTPRYLLQTLGTEWGRKNVREDLWLLLAERQIEKHRAMGVPGVIVSDVRFDNEAEFILARQGQLWGVWRKAATAVRAHASEAGISTNHPSRGILNNGSFADLYKRLDQLLGELGAPIG